MEAVVKVVLFGIHVLGPPFQPQAKRVKPSVERLHRRNHNHQKHFIPKRGPLRFPLEPPCRLPRGKGERETPNGKRKGGKGKDDERARQVRMTRSNSMEAAPAAP